MYLKSKKVSLVVLGLLSLAFSRLIFALINDPEGPNLVVVIGLAAIIYLILVSVWYAGSKQR